MPDLAGVKALLVDLDGTVYQAGRVIDGVPEALAALRRRGIPVAFATNTTSRPRSTLVAELAEMGVELHADRLFTAAWAADAYLRERGVSRCRLLVTRALREDLPDLVEDGEPQAVVVGDIAEGFTYERLNAAFRALLEGAELVALARNRYFRSRDGLVLDCGPYVAALEYASGRAATLTGKPSRAFFHAAFEAMGFAAGDVAVVGDDVESDVGGAQRAGARGVLVRTGKFREADLERPDVRPDLVLVSLAELPDRL